MRLRRLRPRGQELRLEAPLVAGVPPPHDLDAEACCLEACLSDSDERRDQVLEVLRPIHFRSEANASILEAVIDLVDRGAGVSVVSVTQWLRDRDKLNEVGGAAYVVQIADGTPAVYRIREQAERIVDLWVRRQAIAICQRYVAEGYCGDFSDTRAWLDGLEGSIYEIARQERKASAEKLGPILKEAFAKVSAAAERGSRITGTSTGYEKLDGKMAGLHDGDLTIIAARPGIGKTAFVLNLAVNVASPRETPGPYGEPPTVEPGLGVAVFSLEMPREQLATRMACSEGRVDLGRLRQGFLQPDDWRRITEAASYLSTLPIWIDDTASLGLLDLRSKVRRIQAECTRPGSNAKKVGLVVVDYLQLMNGRDGVNSREQEISEISRGLKLLAKELNVPVIALSQLNRAVETRSSKDKRPQLSDLRESGAIEQDADNIIFIYRDEYYNPETTNAKGIAELIISKQRNGPTGKVLTRFTASCTRFDNLAAGDYPEMDDE